MADGLTQVGAEFVIKGSSAVVGGEAGWGGAPWAALIYAHLIASSTHWWISPRRHSYHCAAAPNDLRKGSAMGSP